MLFDAALAIQRTDFSDDEQGRATLRKLRCVLELYGQHGKHEDEKIFPSVADADSSVVQALEKEHDKDEQLVNDLLLLIRTYKTAAGERERMQTGYAIHIAFQEFVAFNLQHMVREEKLINPLLWQKFTDEEIVAMQQRVVATITPEDNAKYSRWMLQGCNNRELGTWLANVQARAPREAWQGLYEIALEELGAERTEELTSQRLKVKG